MRVKQFPLSSLIACGLMLFLANLSTGEELKLSQLPPAYRYGNVMLDKNSAKIERNPVVFSHWLHRRKFTCSFCHTDLGFSFKAGATEITEAENRSGKYCGACHNVRVSFTVRGNCKKCHSGNIDFSKAKFNELAGLPRSGFADFIDWVKAEEDKLIIPETRIKEKLTFEKDISLKPESSLVTPVFFSHKIHDKQLNCSNCHPDIFNFKQKRTKGFTMKEMLGGEFCGTCHLSVAFPINNCKRCHSKVKHVDASAAKL